MVYNDVPVIDIMRGEAMIRPAASVSLPVLLLVLLLPVNATAASLPYLDSAQLASRTGTSETILHVPSIGRYSVTAESPTGADFQIVDKMVGVIARAEPTSPGAGSTGLMARTDAFLEPGDYKLRVRHEAGETVTLRVQRFETGNPDTDGKSIPLLPDGGAATGELHDLEIFSYWIVVDEASPTLLVEARGRALTELALWKDGIWDTGIRALRTRQEMEAGRPLSVLELSATLAPGSYLLLCAGGPRAEWAKDSDAQPFSITRGARYLGDMGRMRVTLPEQGTASFLVSGRVVLVEMAAPNARPYRLITGPLNPGVSRYQDARQAAISEKSASLRCSVRAGYGGARTWVTVQGPAGQTVEVGWMGSNLDESGGVMRPFTESTSYLTSVLSSAEGGDSIDTTGLILQMSGDGKSRTTDIRALQAVTLSPDQPLRRRVNCNGSLSFILQPQKKGTYAIVEKEKTGATAAYQFRLLDDVLFSGGSQAAQVKAGGKVELLEKLYYVTISPIGRGVVDFAIVPTTLIGTARTGDIFSSAPPAPQSDFCWPSTAVAQSRTVASYLILGQRSGVALGTVVRKLPAAIEEPLPLQVEPRKTLTFAFTAERDVVLSSTNDAFSPSTVTVDNVPWRSDRIVSKGAHTCSIKNTTSLPQWHVITGTPPDPTANGPRPTVKDPAAVLPSLSEGLTAWRDFARGQAAAYLLTVSEPGSYRISTAGRLAMGITIRTPLRLSVAAASENSDGRNAELTAYLRPGTYMLQAAARGRSMGRAGILLRRVTAVMAGRIRDGETLRATVPGWEVMQADVQVARNGVYTLECLGIDREFTHRFEDADGWPIGEPVGEGPLSATLSPGTYRYVSLSDRDRTRRVLTLASESEPAAYDPNAKSIAIELNRYYEKAWRELDGRPADVFTLSLSSEFDTVLSLTQRMLYRVVDGSGVAAYQGVGGRAVPMRLSAGAWRIEVTSQQEDNGRSYQIALTTGDLSIGGVQRVSASWGTVPVTIGAPGTVEIWSHGTAELDAFLTDESGRVVARGETIPDDWNFRVMASVPAGRYALHYSSPLYLSSPPGVSAAQPSDGGNGQEYSEEYAEEDGQEYSEEYAEEDGQEYAEEDGDGGQGYYEEEEAPAAVMSGAPQLGTESTVRMIARQEKQVAAATGELSAGIELAQEIAVAPFTTREAGVYSIAGQSATPVSVSVYRSGRLVASGSSPLLIPLAAGSAYTLRFWRMSEEKSTTSLQAKAVRAVDAALGGRVEAGAAALRLIVPAGTSFLLESGSDPLLYSAGVDAPFQLLSGAAVSTADGTGWAVRKDGAAMGACGLTPLSLADGVSSGVMVGPGDASFLVSVPARSVALVRTDNPGSTVGLSASPPAGGKAEGYDWSGASVGFGGSLIGLREGSFRGRLWPTEPGSAGRAERRSILSVQMLPLSGTSAMGREDKSLGVPARSAVALTLPPGQRSVEISLERGMSAFAWTNGPAGIIDASTGPVTGTLSAPNGSIVVMNGSPDARMCTVRAAAPPPDAEISDGKGYEAVTAAAAPRSFTVRSARAAASRLFLWGAVDAARFYSQEDGRIYAGEKLATGLGAVLSFPAQQGRLDLTATVGPARAWIAKPDSLRGAFVDREMMARQSALPTEGGALQAAAQAWTFTLDADAFVSLHAENGGVMGLYDRAGECLSAAAGAAGRSIVAKLGRGQYTLYTRPFANAAVSGGLVTLRPLAAAVLEADGEGEPVLIGPRDLVLYKFTVTVKGKVGCGIRSQNETLAATLYDSRFTILDTGRLFVRTLEPGPYYMLAASGGDTQRFTPVVYGLGGNDMQIPDDIITSYRGE
jgi:hypothetical protein